MASQALEAFAAEVAAQQAALVPIIEGLEDYNRLNITPETKSIVQSSLAEAKKRQTLCENAMKALMDLQADNYPGLPVKTVKTLVYEDLAAQRFTIETALSKFAPEEEAATAEIVAGEPQPK